MKFNRSVFFSLFLIVSLLAFAPVALGQPAAQQVNAPASVYKCDSVMFTGTNTALQYGATLTIPNGGKKYPAIILVSGTGRQDRNGTMAGHKLFADIADHLSSRGYVVLRVDDRGVGKSTGDYERSTTADFADDVLEAFAYLEKRPEVAFGKVGVLGHSEGGMTCSIAASKQRGIAFIVSLAGLALKGFDALVVQNRDLVNASAMSDIDKQRSNEINNLMFTTAYNYADSVNMDQKLNETYNEWKKKDDEAVKARHIEFDHFRFPVYSYVKQATGPWYRYFIKYDPAPVLAKIKVPVLAINGDKDLMVSSVDNLKNWKELTGGKKDKNVTIVSIPGINHLFLPCVKCDLQEYSSIKSSFSIQALSVIENWLRKNR